MSKQLDNTVLEILLERQRGLEATVAIEHVDAELDRLWTDMGGEG